MSNTGSATVSSIGASSAAIGEPIPSYYPTVISGYTCNGCGQWVTNGIYHYCTGQQPITTYVPPTVTYISWINPKELQEILAELKELREEIKALKNIIDN